MGSMKKLAYMLGLVGIFTASTLVAAVTAGDFALTGAEREGEFVAQQDAAEKSITDAVAEARAEFEEKIRERVQFSRERKLPEPLAEILLRWPHRPEARLNYIFLPDSKRDAAGHGFPPRPDGDQYDEYLYNGWAAGFLSVRQQHAHALFQLAADAADEGNAGLALSLANQALREDPDSETSRQFFGYKRHENQWLTDYEIAKSKAGEVWDDRFGWLPAEDLPRYEAGERKNRSRWVSAERDAVLHQSLDLGWRIETEHFLITTNHSLEAGAALGKRLELLYQAWRIVFADYYLSASQLKGAFTRVALPNPRQKFRVNYFASEDEFRSALARELPQNAQTTGVYLSARKTSFFYHAEPEDHATQFHEVTHQLFQEAGGRAQLEPGRDNNFWLVEAIACYMESLQLHEPREPFDVPYLTTGGIAAARVQDARFYLFRQDFHEPLADMCALGRTEFQQHPELRKVYAQGAAVADMLLHADDGAHRQPTITLLKGLYQGRRTNLPPLAYTALDELYVDFMNVRDADLATLSAGGDVSYLTLGGTDVTDAGLEQLVSLEGVRWIDLAQTAVTDEGVKHLAKLPGLAELDLSATKISDAALDALADAPNLNKLTIIGTNVSDAAVNRLKAVRRGLEVVR